MDIEEIDTWFSPQQRSIVVNTLVKRIGLTRIRAEYFVRLWIYLLVKQQQQQQPSLKPPLLQLELPQGEIECTHREAAELFYSDQDKGSDRSAGMMLDKLVALRLIKKFFDGNSTTIEIQPLSEVIGSNNQKVAVQLQIDNFNARCDAIPVANLLATNYNWMNRNNNAAPQRIARLLREWANQYSKGMRVLRRCDNHNPVGFYLLYPTIRESEVNFFTPAVKSLYLSVNNSDIDPFKMAIPPDDNCLSVFIRSWMIDIPYLAEYRVIFLEDLQFVLRQMLVDFPHLCDVYTLIIHPLYQEITEPLGFQKNSHNTQSSVYWMYMALERFLALEIKSCFS